MTTQTIPAISTPSRRAVALGATVALVLAALLVGALAGAGAAALWQSRIAASSATGAVAVAAPRTPLDPAAHQYGARAAQLEAALATTGAATGTAAVVATRPALDPAAHHYGARAAQLEVALAVTGAPALRTPVDPESRFYGRTRLVRPSSPDVASPVGAVQVRSPESRFYGKRSGS